MKIVVVDPGADWSTRDVYDGLCMGLFADGVEVIPYRFGRRFGFTKQALALAWKRGDRTRVRPTDADAALQVSELAVTWALRHQPDWMLVVSGMFFHPDAFILARRAGVRTALLLTESPYDYEQEFRVCQLVDMAWTNERTAVEPLRPACPPVAYLPHAYNPGRHTPELARETDAPAHDVVFVGTGFAERIELLEAIDWTGIDLGLYGTWGMVGRRSPLRRYLRAGITDNSYTSGLYARAKIGLNLHRQSKGFGRRAPRIFGCESLNPRAYELAACGCFHLSDLRAEVSERFGSLVPTFRCAAELQDLVRAYLADDSERQRVAALLPEAVRGHSWIDRARQVVADLTRVQRGTPASSTA